MLRESRKRLHDLSVEEIQVIAEDLCFGKLDASPIYECVKVFAKVNSSGQMTYARHSSDLGTSTTTAQDITSRFKREDIKQVVSEALALVEAHVLPHWPFAHGSSSWVQLEILDKSIRQKGPINPPAIVFRKAVRLSNSKKVSAISTSPLVERMFSGFSDVLPNHIGRFAVIYNPKLTLKNLAGTGILSEGLDQLAKSNDEYITAEEITQHLIRENLNIEPFLSPGFIVDVCGTTFQIVSDLYRSTPISEPKPEPLPLPIVGIVR